MFGNNKERSYEINEEDKVNLITFDYTDFVEIDVSEYDDIGYQSIYLKREYIYAICKILKEEDECKIMQRKRL